MKLKPISKVVLRNLGVDLKIGLNENLEDLRKQGPQGIVIATPTRSFYAVSQDSASFLLKKKVPYVMSMAVFYQLQYFDAMYVGQKAKRKALRPAGMKFRKVYKPYLGQDLSGKKILVWRTGGIGDLLFIQPNLRKLKEWYPDCYVTFACARQYQSMVETWDEVDKLIDLPFPARFLTEADYHIIFEGVIERCKEAETTNAYKLFSKWLNIEVPEEELVPKQKTRPKTDEEVLKIIKEKFNLEPKEYIVASLRSSAIIRTPDPQVTCNILSKLIEKGYKIVLTDSAKHSELLDGTIKKFLSDSTNVFNFAPYSKELSSTISLIKFSRLVIAPDTSLVHLAAALDVPCFGIYGPFPGKIRLSTYPKADWIEGNIECSPCFTHGSKPCKNNINGFSKCFYNIDSDQAVGKIEKLLERYE